MRPGSHRATEFGDFVSVPLLPSSGLHIKRSFRYHRGFWEDPVNLFYTIPKSCPPKGLKVHDSIASTVDAGVDLTFRPARLGIELHRIALYAHDRACVRGQQDVRDLGEHRVRQILHHQVHAWSAPSTG